MAISDEPKWAAGDYKIDRYDLNIQEKSNNALASAGNRIMSMFGSQPKSMPLKCQVDGCTEDISKMKDYHARYKICEPHLKASAVTKDGRTQRFCQQCGKFHDISEFDGDKRSCRARLDKHNTRRRRQREMQHMLRTTGRVDEAALRMKYGMTEEELAPKIHRLQKQMRLSNNTHSTTSSEPVSSGLSVSAGDAHAQLSSNPMMPVPGLPGITQADLDLLGEGFLEDVLGPGPLAGAAASKAGPGFMAIDPGSVMDLDDIAVLEELTKEFGLNPNEAALAAANGGLQPAGLFGGSSATATVSADASGQFAMNAMMLDPLLASQQASAFPFSVRQSTGNSNAAALLAMAQGSAPRTVTTGIDGLTPPPYYQTNATAQNNNNFPNVRSSASSDATSVLEEALNLLAYDQTQVHYQHDERLVRLSTKLFGCTPADLPPDLKTSLQDMLGINSMEGYMRPGCVHIEVNGMLGTDDQALLVEGGMHAAVERFLESSPDIATSAHTVVMQLGNKLAMIKNGELQYVLDTAGATKLMPSIAAVRPLARLATTSASQYTELTLWGYNLGREGDTVLARSRGLYLNAEIVGEAEDVPDWEGLQRVQIRVQGRISPGSLQIEILRGSYVSAARSTIIAPTPEIAAEICTLESTVDMGEIDTLLYGLGALLEATTGGSGVLSSINRKGPVVPGKVARNSLPFVIQRKWPAMTKVCLDACFSDIPVSEAMSMVDVMSVGSTGMPLIQLAVRTQNTEILAALLKWGRQRGHEFKATTPGRRGLTALHLAALVKDGGLTAALLTAGCPDALAGWEGIRAEDGSTPLALAHRFGTSVELERLIAQTHYASLQSKSAFATAPNVAPLSAKGYNNNPDSNSLLDLDRAASSSSDISIDPMMSWKSGMTMEGSLPLPGIPDDIAIAKATNKGSSSAALMAASSRLLTFNSPELESKYARWYNAGQVPVDVAFMVIAIASQIAWVLRWNMADSIILSSIMILLIVFNSVSLLIATMRPQWYIARREAVCVSSILLHKLGQLAVTAMPGVGTIYSPTYNMTVSLLESSSFAQIAMLTFGMKARVAAHIPTLLAVLPLSAAINGSICNAAFGNFNLTLCSASMFAFQFLASFVLPSAAVYFSERRSRQVFLETAVA